MNIIETNFNLSYLSYSGNVKSRTPLKINSNSNYIPYSSLINNDYRYAAIFTMSCNHYFTRNALSYLKGTTITIDMYSNSILNNRLNNINYISNYRNSNYKKLFLSDDLMMHCVSRNNYISGVNSVYHIDNDNIISPLYVLVVKKEYIEYARKCMLLREKPHKDIFKLLVNEELDITNSRYGLIRTKYRKNIKKPFLAAGIEIETVSNFDDIFIRIEIPKALGLTGYQSKLNEISTEFLKQRKENKSEKYSEFEINY